MPNVKPVVKTVEKVIDFMMAFKPQSIKQVQTKLESLLSKGWKQIGVYENAPLLQHSVSGNITVLDRNSLKLVPKAKFPEMIAQRTAEKARLDAIKAVKKDEKKANQKIKEIADHIFDDAKKRDLGLVDFSLENWQSLTPGHTMTPDEIKLYTTKTLPVIEKTYKELVKKGELFSDINHIVHGIRDGKEFILKTPQDVMAHIMMCTPQGKKLIWTGKTFYSGTPQKYKNSMEKFGGMQYSYTKTGTNVPTWLNTDVRGAREYQNPNRTLGGFSAYIAPIKPSIALPYLQKLGIKPKIAKAYDEPFIIHTNLENPTSEHYLSNGIDISNAMKVPYKDVAPYAPFHFAISEKPVIDVAASRSQGSSVRGLFGIIGEDLPRKAIFGGSGQYDLSNPGLFKGIIPLVTFGGLANYLYGQNRTDI